jgi:hypothetical protein
MDKIENQSGGNQLSSDIKKAEEHEMEDILFARLSSIPLYRAPSCYGAYPVLSQREGSKCGICPVRPPCKAGKNLEVRRVKKGLYG